MHLYSIIKIVKPIFRIKSPIFSHFITFKILYSPIHLYAFPKHWTNEEYTIFKNLFNQLYRYILGLL